MRTTAPLGIALATLLIAPAAAEEAQVYRVAGHDLARGSFTGELRLAADQDGQLQLERRVAFADGTSEVWRGRASRQGQEVRAVLASTRGLRGRLGDETQQQISFRLRVDAAGAACQTECREDGRPVSRSRGRRVEDEAQAEGSPEDAVWTKVEDPKVPRPRSGAHVVDEAGRPSLEGTHGEGWHVWTGVPFVQGEGDAREIDPNDVKQKGLAHCYFAGALIAVARTDPEWIRGAIHDPHDGTFTVTWRKVLEGKRDARVEIDNAFPYETAGDGEKKTAFMPFRDRTTVTLYDPWGEGETIVELVELWPQILEKAWAVHHGGYEAIEWSRASRVFDAISGIESLTLTCKDMTGHEIEAALAKAFKAGHPVALGSKSYDKLGDAAFEVGLVGVHTYALWNIDGEGHAELYNAWASSHPSRAMTGEEIKSSFNRIYIGRF